MREKIKKIIRENFKCWGCLIETELPPEFVISRHAEERLEERFKCSPDKYKKITVKAWYSKQQISKKLFNQLLRVEVKKKAKISFKFFNGHVFIFDNKWNRTLGYTQKVLITLYNPKINKWDKF